MGAIWSSITNYFSTAGATKITADLLGIVILVISLISPQLKRKWQMLTLSISANLLSGVQNLLLGAVTAVGVCAVAVIWAILGIRHARRGTAPKLYMIGIFSVLFVLGGLTPFIVGNTWSKFVWYDALPIIGALMLMLSVAQKKEQHMRIFSLVNCCIFTVHCAIIGSTQIISQIIGIISITTALIRYGIADKKKARAEALAEATAEAVPAPTEESTEKDFVSTVKRKLDSEKAKKLTSAVRENADVIVAVAVTATAATVIGCAVIRGRNARIRRSLLKRLR